MKNNTFQATLIEIVKRLVSFEKNLGVYVNGDDNNYPERIERIINNSVTAKSSASIMKKFITGKGFDVAGPDGKPLNDFIVHKESGLTVYGLLSDIAESYAYQKGCFIHANYTLDGPAISSLTTFPYKWCRIGKKDDTDWHGKIAVHQYWDDEKEVKKAAKAGEIQLIDVYNESAAVLKAQIQKAGSLDDYKGQVYFMNPEHAIYPLAHIDGSAYNDADSEFRSSTFKNISLRKGFFGKMIAVTKPLTGAYAAEPDALLSDEDLARKRHLETQREAFKETLKSFIGAQNSDGVMHMETDFEGDNIDGVIKFVTVDTNINDKLFEYTEKSAANNIRKAFQNVPSILIENSDNSIFGQSGEMLKQAKLYYQEETADERRWIASEIRKLLKRFKGLENIEIPEIAPLVSENTQPKQSSE